MICAGEAQIWKPVGTPRDHEESKIDFVRQLRATYCATTSWPLATGGPDPLISVLTTRLLGGADEGILTVGAPSAAAETVGRPAPPSDTWAPEADAVPVEALIMSTTTTTVSVPVTPACGLPAAPKPYLGRRTASTRLPIFLPSSAVCSPGSRWPDRTCGVAV